MLTPALIWFQSLGRDSVHSSVAAALRAPPFLCVSIPRSGFCSFKLQNEQSKRADFVVSIPRSGFCSFKRQRVAVVASRKIGFNPSVGILFIQAFTPLGGLPCVSHVSIPRSGFCSFKHHLEPAASREAGVSIPRSGFCSFKRRQKQWPDMESTGFNPSVGILFIQALHRRKGQGCPCCFNPSVGILFIQAGQPGSPTPGNNVSIPRSGFCSFKPHLYR